MASLMKKVKVPGIENTLYPWGKAELTDKWIILHKNGLPKWAILCREKSLSIAIPCNGLGSRNKPIKRRVLKSVRKANPPENENVPYN